MRKFYSPLAVLLSVLISFQTNARTTEDSCRADFEKVSSTTNNGLTSGFQALPWINNDKKPEQICWNFGDNHDTCINYDPALSNNYYVSHTYANAGVYNVCIRIKYQGGCVAEKCKLQTIGEPDNCTANFEVGFMTLSPLGRHFTAIPWNNHNKKPVYICWKFGDNRDTCIQYSNSFAGPYSVNHIYRERGQYEVCVRIVYEGGCESKKCKIIQVGEVSDSCRADFEKVSLTTINGLTAGFRALPWINNDKKPEQICWKFGDNHDTCINYDPALSNNYYVSHTYANAGVYNVCVRIKYQGGCVAEKCKLQTIGERDSCTANFEVGLISSSPLGRHFTAIPWNNHNKKPVYICWKFGDNRDTCIQYSNSFTGPYSVNHIYRERGQYEVCVRIVYEGGCESKKCKIIQVGEVSDSCRADFERIPASSTNNPSLVHFRALPWNNHEKRPARICWLFGDGQDTCISYPENYTGPYTVGHYYARSGIYEVCVKIYYYGGCEAKKCKSVNVFLFNECRVRLYEIVPSATSLQRGFYFVSSNDNRPARICWDFGDGTDTCISIEPNATEIPHVIRHTYPGPGVYRACVKVLFMNGCTASDCREVVIRSLTDLCGGYYTDSLVNPRTYLFRGFGIHKPDDPVISYRWTFGDGSLGVGEKVTHTYNAPGVYRVCLLINTEKGCETKICNNVRIAGETQLRLQLTPNPVINVLHALFYSTHNETVKIKIINSNGAVVREYTRNAVIGSNTWEFEVSGLLPGVYSFVVQSPNQFSAGIFFKQ